MAFLDEFRFSMRPNDTLWYYWDNGVLNTSATARYTSAPNQWQATGAKWARSYEQRGLKRSIAQPYQHVRDAAAILRAIYLSGSIENKVYFLIEKLKEDKTGYEVFFSGEIDLGTYLDGVLYNKGQKAVSAAVIEGGVSATLDANENTPFEVVIDPLDCDVMNLDGVELRGTYNYLLLADTVGTSIGPGMVSIYGAFTVQEGDFPVATPQNTPGMYLADHMDTDFSNAPNPDAAFDAFALEALQTMNIVVTAAIPNFYYSNTTVGAINIQATLEVLVVNGANPYNIAQRQILHRDAVLGAGNNRTLATSFQGTSTPLTINANDRVFIVLYFYKTGAAGTASFDYNYPEGTAAISTDFTIPATDCNSYQYWAFVQKFLDKVTGVTNVAESDFFSNTTLTTYDCHPFNVRLTCGDVLRRLTTNPVGVSITPSIRTTWAELKKDMRCRFGLGVDIRNNKVIIEEAGDFFDESQIIADLGPVKSFTYEPSKEWFATSQKWGYAARTDGKLNGRDEPNSTQVWKMPTIRIPKDEDCLCPYSSGMYEIEEARVNLSGKKTIDSASDNTTFCIETEGFTTGGKYNLYRPQNSYTQPAETGLLSYPTAFNLTMTPKRNLLRSGKFVRMPLYNLDTSTITFQGTEKNSETNVNLGSGAISEKAPILVSSLDPAFAKPFLFHVEAITPIAMKQSMDAMPSGCFPFESEGVQYAGFPIEVGINGAQRNSYQMTLLCTPSTDVTPLIKL